MKSLVLLPLMTVSALAQSTTALIPAITPGASVPLATITTTVDPQPDPSRPDLAHFRQGHFSVATAEMGLGFRASNQGAFYAFKPRVEYYLLERLGVGVVGGTARKFEQKPTWDLGQSLSYYYWQHREFHAYGNSTVWAVNVGGVNNESVKPMLEVSAGFNYALTRRFSLGPRVAGRTGENVEAFKFFLANLYLYL